MKKSVAGFLVASCLIIAASSAAAQPTAAPELATSPSITVYVYDYAQTSPSTLERAAAEATYVFHEAGVDVTWITCLAAQPSAGSDCNQPKGPAEFVLRILRPNKAAEKAFRASVFGYTVRDIDGGTLATVFYDRVEKVARHEELSIGVVLGYAVAHELGHLVLLTEDHSPTGLMRAGFTHQDWQLAAQGALLFSPEQAEAIRGTVLTKLSARAATE